MLRPVDTTPDVTQDHFAKSISAKKNLFLHVAINKSNFLIIVIEKYH